MFLSVYMARNPSVYSAQGKNMQRENYISISFHIEWDMIVVIVFEPNGISFGSELKGRLLPRSDLIQFERKWK